MNRRLADPAPAPSPLRPLGAGPALCVAAQWKDAAGFLHWKLLVSSHATSGRCSSRICAMADADPCGRSFVFPLPASKPTAAPLPFAFLFAPWRPCSCELLYGAAVLSLQWSLLGQQRSVK